MSAQRLEQKGRYFSSAGLPQRGHCAWMRTARNGRGRSGGLMAAQESRGPTKASTGRAAPTAAGNSPHRGDQASTSSRRLDLLVDLIELVEAEVGQRNEHRRAEARIEALQRDFAAVGEAHGILVQAAFEARHDDFFGRADAQRLLQGLVDAFETQMRAGGNAGGGVAVRACRESHRAGTKPDQLVGFASDGGN